MSNVQYIWAELGAKHVKLGQEQEQLEKLTKLIEKVRPIRMLEFVLDHLCSDWGART